MLFNFFLFGLIALVVAQTTVTTTQSTTTDSNITTAGQFTSTPTSTSSAATNNPTTAATTVPPFATTPSLVSAETIFCTCDLTSRACDLNCCCDPDCTDADKTVFSACTESTADDAQQICVSKKALFAINVQSGVSDYEAFETESEWCIKEKNYQARNSIFIPTTATNDVVYQALSQDQTSFSYTSEVTFETIRDLSNTNYKTGDNILGLTANNALSNFNLPFHAASSTNCVDGTPAVFLEDASYSCWREFIEPLSVACLAQETLGYEFYTKSAVRVFSRPTTETSIKEDLLVSVNGNYSQTNYDPNMRTCLNTVTEVHYTVYHRGGTITQVSADIRQENITLTNNYTTSIQQKFSVNFLSTSASSATQRSGNPGYIIGKPIISGQLTTNGLTVSTDPTQYLSLLGFNSNGECDRTVERHRVLFGEETRSGCWLNNTPMSCNLTEPTARRMLTEKTLTASTYISSLGNGTTRKLGNWVPLLHPTTPSYDPPQCSGLQMVLTILYSRVGSLTNPQNRIAGASLSYSLLELKDSSNYQINPEDSKFVVESVVNFLDITQDTQDSSQESVYSQRSHVDFFYPFIYANEIGT